MFSEGNLWEVISSHVW